MTQQLSKEAARQARIERRRERFANAWPYVTCLHCRTLYLKKKRMRVGDILRLALTLHDYTEAEFAQLIGQEPRIVRYWLRSEAPLTWGWALRIEALTHWPAELWPMELLQRLDWWKRHRADYLPLIREVEAHRSIARPRPPKIVPPKPRPIRNDLPADDYP